MNFYEDMYPESYERHSDETFWKRYFGLRGRLNRHRYIFRQLLLWLSSFIAERVMDPYLFPTSTGTPTPGVWESVQNLFTSTAYAAQATPVAWGSGSGSVIVFLGGLFAFLCSISSLTLTLRRIHDRDHSWLYLLLLCIPLVNFVVGFQLLFLRGTVGPNRYGPDPVDEVERPLL